eukprot:CAMPEP_0118903672 /NCGR_PEP_ID=MMETSP1166-20130328/8452_1 /TAXON_ID=1104430 /ORGANISM="Chrysoreinhardia sp, Strain CCMP3193" /LENGTH=256 /DNA_ID=CAMNT_0006842905 /DNA_START=13 /DNA_END=783 /DNA_ORIENTATION=+
MVSFVLLLRCWLLSPLLVGASRRRPLPFVVEAANVDDGAGSILGDASYKVYASMRTISARFAVAEGDGASWRWLGEVFEDVERYDPLGPPVEKGHHVAIGHFAASLEDLRLRELAAARDHFVALRPADHVVACAFLSKEPSDTVFTSCLADLGKKLIFSHHGGTTMPTALKNKAKELGVVVFFGQVLGQTVALAGLQARLATLQADLAEAKGNSVEALRAANDDAKRSLDEARATIAHLETQLAKLQSEDGGGGSV